MAVPYWIDMSNEPTTSDRTDEVFWYCSGEAMRWSAEMQRRAEEWLSSRPNSEGRDG